MSKKKSKAKRKSAKSGQPTPWDALFKAFFSHKIIVESLLTSFLAQDIQTGIDWTTLEPWNSSHVTKALKQRFAEIKPIDKTINFTEAKEMMAAKALRWREEIYNEGLAKGISMMEAKEAENSVTLKKEAKADVALKMLKAGKPRSEIVLFTDLSEAELDNIVLQ